MYIFCSMCYLGLAHNHIIGTIYKPLKFGMYDTTTLWETFEFMHRNRIYIGNKNKAEHFQVGLLLEMVGSYVKESKQLFNPNNVIQSYKNVKTALNYLYSKAVHRCSARIHFKPSQRLADETIAAYVL